MEKNSDVLHLFQQIVLDMIRKDDVNCIVKDAVRGRILSDMEHAFSKAELYDIHVNDRLETDDKILEEIETSMQNTLMNITIAHFFFVTNVVAKVSNGTSERMDTRMLEMDKWKDYLGYDDGHPRIA